MANKKESFELKCDLIHTVNLLPDDIAGKLLKLILQYSNGENPEIIDPTLKVAFEPIRQQHQDASRKREERAKRSRENGKKGGRPSGTKKIEKIELITPEPEKPREIFSEKVSETVIKDENVIVVAPVKSEKPKVKPIPDRKDEFKKLLEPFRYTYTADMLNKFYSYWTEHGPKDRKMRFEKQTSFDVKKRLITWRDNQKKFNGTSTKTGRDTRTGAAGTNERKDFKSASS